MITPEKIEEWIQEVQERPASAALIMRYIANRLHELSERNEELLAENIALMTGKRVEEYERRIAHLEYQIELLKRQSSSQIPSDLPAEPSEHISATEQETISVLIYNEQGQVLRYELAAQGLTDGEVLGCLQGPPVAAAERPRLLAVRSMEELLFIFTSGRIATLPAAMLPLAQQAGNDQEAKVGWETAPIPHAPNPGESLACIRPISKMPFAESLVQVSRKGFVKKIGAAMVETILANHYIGVGIKQSADATFELALCGKADQLVLVSWEGYLACLDIEGLHFSIEEAMRLGMTDHLVAAFILDHERSILVVTQVGKVIHRNADVIEPSRALRVRGQSLYSQQRRESGVRVVGAAAVNEKDWGIVLESSGRITLHAIQSLFGSGAIHSEAEITAFTSFSLPQSL
ncbi:MAG: hypothetical protein JW726_01625 [Anaerolineales bacterium]|nr:hypothetical protein [Anaerolineales bacterium]